MLIITVHCTCCYDETKGTQDLKICLHAMDKHALQPHVSSSYTVELVLTLVSAQLDELSSCLNRFCCKNDRWWYTRVVMGQNLDASANDQQPGVDLGVSVTYIVMYIYNMYVTTGRFCCK